MARKSAKLRWIIGVPLGTTTLVVAGVLLNNYREQGALNRALTQARAVGLVTDNSYFTPKIPDNENAALYPSADFKTTPKFARLNTNFRNWTGVDITTLKADCKSLDTQLAALTKAAQRTHWSPHRNYSSPSITGWPELPCVKEYVKLFGLRALLKWREGDHSGAQEDMATASRLANLLGEDPLSVGQLVANACVAIIQLDLASIVKDGDGSPDAQRIVTAVVSILNPPSFKLLINSQLMESLDSAKILAQHDGPRDQWIEYKNSKVPFHFPARERVMQTAVAKYFAKVMETASKDPQDPSTVFKELKKVNPDFPHFPAGEAHALQNIVVDDQSTFFADRLRISFQNQLLSVASQILTFKHEYGKLPKSLSDLPKEVNTTDPFTGKQLLYRIKGDKFVVWSTGIDGNDDTHGSLSSKSSKDYMFQTIDPKFGILRSY